MYVKGGFQGGEGDAPFNMAMMFYFRINELLAAKDRAAISNDVSGYASCLKAVFNNVYFQIKDEKDTKDIKAGLDRAMRILSCPLPQDQRLAMQTLSMNNAEAKIILDDIDMKLMVIMDKKKMIFPRIEVTQGIAAMRARMGLNNEKG